MKRQIRKERQYKRPVTRSLQYLLHHEKEDGIATLGLKYLEALKSLNRSHSTISQYRWALYEFCSFAHSRSIFSIHEVGEAVLLAWQQELSRRTSRRKDDLKEEKKRPLQVNTQNKLFCRVLTFLTWLCKKGILAKDPGEQIELPRNARILPREWFNLKEVEKILARPDTKTPSGLRDRAMMEVLYSTGMRRSEVVSLKLDDVLFEEGLIRILEGKGQRDRFVPVGERALFWIRLYLKEGRSAFFLPPEPSWLFLSATQNPLSPGSFGNRVRVYMKEAGVHKKGTCHLFRHTFATHLLNNGADLRSVQLMLGHSSLQTTQIYTHVALQSIKAMHQRLHPAENGEKKRDV